MYRKSLVPETAECHDLRTLHVTLQYNMGEVQTQNMRKNVLMPETVAGMGQYVFVQDCPAAISLGGLPKQIQQLVMSSSMSRFNPPNGSQILLYVVVSDTEEHV